MGVATTLHNAGKREQSQIAKVPASPTAAPAAPASAPAGRGQKEAAVRSLKRTSALSEDVIPLLEAGEPFLLTQAMPWLEGQKVLEFMPRLMAASGRDIVRYEIQEKKACSQLSSPLAHYIQEIQRSRPGAGYLMASDDVLR
ncbi:hypothetical protein AK812_SmicGene15848 [Symbiodinium microadriaticum]|uniref:Uncharacterized protein n=1 Tax=Symbiodinium microadriaticum TaxID=2951 RepID=A0A1Q9E1U9_SYMMI|nr:hypothetical protein AK812_SmicGene15848 [Symbiodinium microadriaticum]